VEYENGAEDCNKSILMVDKVDRVWKIKGKGTHSKTQIIEGIFASRGCALK
jgi:hypothetical protein